MMFNNGNEINYTTIDLLDHNQRTYENICRMYNEGIQRVAVVQPTGSGKSLLMAKMIEDNPNSRFFVLSTSHKINDQFKEKLDEDALKRVDFNIYCNMPNMKQETMESLQPDYIFLDEMHRALAKEWSKGINVLLEVYPNAKVLGLSATPIRYLDRCINVVNELFGGNLACDMSLSQAILDNILPMARYVCGVYSFEKDTESLNKKIEKSCNSDEEKKELLEQVKVLKQNLDKANGVSEIIRKYVVSGNEKFVVFLKDTTHLKDMKPVIEKWFTDAGFAVRMYEVHSKNVDKDKEFQAFKEDTEEGAIKACLSVNMVAEGIHGDIDGVIMLRETMSPNLYFQMIGRAFSCGKKTIPLIFDLVANSQFISDAVDNFPNELRGEIEKRKEECEKEGKDYEVGFNVDEFIVMDEFMDVVSGFRAIEGRLIGDWENGLRYFDKYVREHDGDVLVPARYKDEDGFFLGSWVNHNREVFKKKTLPSDRINELNKRGFVWDKYKYDFEVNIRALKQYRAREGNCLVPKWHIESLDGIEVKLDQWCRNMRMAKKGKNHNLLTLEMENELTQLGFVWDVIKFNFENNIIKVADYYRKNKRYPSQHTKYDNLELISLASFVNNEKNKINTKAYPVWKQEIIKKYLSELLNNESVKESSFKKFLFYAKKYKNKFGHMDVKQNEIIDGYNLGRKITNLKMSYKKGKLTTDKIKKLEDIGIYLGNVIEKRYSEKIELSKRAINEGVIIKKTNQYYKDVNLYEWVIQTIKKKYQNNKLSLEDKMIIEELVNKSLESMFYKRNKVIEASRYN